MDKSSRHFFEPLLKFIFTKNFEMGFYLLQTLGMN